MARSLVFVFAGETYLIIRNIEPAWHVCYIKITYQANRFRSHRSDSLYNSSFYIATVCFAVCWGYLHVFRRHSVEVRHSLSLSGQMM